MTSAPGAATGEGRQPAPEPLWREVLGLRLRSLRVLHGRTLAEAAMRAGISPQYLSEVERGLKEPSSEMIAAILGALDTSLVDLTVQVAGDLRRRQLRDVIRSPGRGPERLRSADEMLADVAGSLGTTLMIQDDAGPLVCRLDSAAHDLCGASELGTVMLAA